MPGSSTDKPTLEIGDLVYCHAVGSKYGWHLDKVGIVVDASPANIAERKEWFDLSAKESSTILYPGETNERAWLITFNDGHQHVLTEGELDRGHAEIIGRLNIDEAHKLPKKRFEYKRLEEIKKIYEEKLRD